MVKKNRKNLHQLPCVVSTRAYLVRSEGHQELSMTFHIGTYVLVRSEQDSFKGRLGRIEHASRGWEKIMYSGFSCRGPGSECIREGQHARGQKKSLVTRFSPSIISPAPSHWKFVSFSILVPSGATDGKSPLPPPLSLSLSHSQRLSSRQGLQGPIGSYTT